MRRTIREYLRLFENQKKNEVLVRENKLRSLIQDIIIIEAKEDRPHHSTGVNVLSDLLKKTIPVLEIDFKKLTTNEKQRQSFINHILKAVQNTLTREKVEDEAGGEAEKNATSFNNSELAEAEINLDDQDQEMDLREPLKPVDPQILADQEKFIDVERPSRRKKEDQKNPALDFGIPRRR